MAGRYQKLQSDYEILLSKYNSLRGNLKCKTEALLILSQEQEQCRSERDQYKLMANQLRERYSALKKRVEGWGPSLIGVYDIHGVKGEREQNLVQLLCELKEKNKSLQHEVNNLTERLSDALGDLKVLREERHKMAESRAKDEVFIKFSASEKETLVKQLEIFSCKCSQLERDLQAICDEKEDLVTTCDAYRSKFERLNQQLHCLLRGDQHSYVDIDGVIMENRILGRRIAELEQKIKSLETTSLWKFHDKSHSKYQALEDDFNVDSLSPEHSSLKDSFLSEETKTVPMSDESKAVITVTDAGLDTSFSDLDILPSKDCSAFKYLKKERKESASSSVTNSKTSSPFQSPSHHSKTSDSESTPKKSPMKLSSHLYPNTAIDLDLPPKLQELFLSAFAELENNPENDEQDTNKDTSSNTSNSELNC